MATAQASAQRFAGIGHGEIIDHLLLALEANQPVSPNWVFNDEQLTWLDANLKDDSDVRPLMQDLPSGITSAAARLFGKFRSQRDVEHRSTG